MFTDTSEFHKNQQTLSNSTIRYTVHQDNFYYLSTFKITLIVKKNLLLTDDKKSKSILNVSKPEIISSSLPWILFLRGWNNSSFLKLCSFEKLSFTGQQEDLAGSLNSFIV